jgi:hypothetical protein
VAQGAVPTVLNGNIISRKNLFLFSNQKLIGTKGEGGASGIYLFGFTNVTEF